MRNGRLIAMFAMIVMAYPAFAAPDVAALAAKFGAREGVIDASIAPDGKHVALLIPGKGRATDLLVAGSDGKDGRVVSTSDGAPFKLFTCGWSSSDRLVCNNYGLVEMYGQLSQFTRLVALDANGGRMIPLQRKMSGGVSRNSQFDGAVIDWLKGDGSVLMTRDFVAAAFDKTNIKQDADGLGVEIVNTVTGLGRTVERPRPDASDYISDGNGHVRISARDLAGAGGVQLSGVTAYFYRPANGGGWQPFSRNPLDGHELRPIAVDPASDSAYALKGLNGRDALYRVALDGSMRTDLVYADPRVDVGNVVRVGRGGRVIGASYVTDRNEVSYFDPEYASLGKALGKAIPRLPLIRFIDASADEQSLLILASSDVDPGRYYVFDRASKRLAELALARPELESVPLSPVRSVNFPAADGTMIPGYLTLPPGGITKGLPAIVMPHGGPAARDQWGFDWLAQFFAQDGFAVLQPNYRGSTGYGESWYLDNGFKSWRTAIGDVNAAGRWLVAQGIADPAKLAIFGWSYGGYAALQTQVLDPDLFKAAVAVAPVTDLAMLKEEERFFTDFATTSAYIGSGETTIDASPVRHVDAFKIPVLMFHGDRDRNVAIGESRAMDAALRRAGKQSRLVVYPGLDHQLDDSAARTDMLTQADAFLRTALKLP